MIPNSLFEPNVTLWAIPVLHTRMGWRGRGEDVPIRLPWASIFPRAFATEKTLGLLKCPSDPVQLVWCRKMEKNRADSFLLPLFLCFAACLVTWTLNVSCWDTHWVFCSHSSQICWKPDADRQQQCCRVLSAPGSTALQWDWTSGMLWPLPSQYFSTQNCCSLTWIPALWVWTKPGCFFFIPPSASQSVLDETGQKVSNVSEELCFVLAYASPEAVMMGPFPSPSSPFCWISC